MTWVREWWGGGGGGGGEAGDGNSENFREVCRWNFEYTSFSYDFQSDKTYLFNLHEKKKKKYLII